MLRLYVTGQAQKSVHTAFANLKKNCLELVGAEHLGDWRFVARKGRAPSQCGISRRARLLQQGYKKYRVYTLEQKAR